MPARLSIRIVRLFALFLAILFVVGTILRAQADSGILSTTWHLTGNNGAIEAYQKVDSAILTGKSAIQITYDLHGTCLISGDASALIFDQNGWKYVSLANYGKNCQDGQQTVTINLQDFKDIDSGTALQIYSPLTGYFHVRFWSGKAYTIDITNISISGTSGTPTPTSAVSSIQSTPTAKPTTNTPTPTSQPVALTTTASGTWQIQSIDAMKDTKDAICGQRADDWITNWVAKAKELGANYVAISTPYENPTCGDALAYTKRWVKIIRSQGLHVWHRHMPLAFEGIYSTSKAKANYLPLIQKYITSNPDIFAPGDIFSPIPEPQNGGIQGITYCANSVCQFNSAADFNQWLRDAMTTATNAFNSINIQNIKIGYFGFDGFVAWGDNNPDWHGILEDATVKQMGNITIDHYPETVNETMDASLTALQAKYPNTLIVIGEWGTVDGKNVVQEVQNTMGAAKAHGIVGFNYWQFGPSGSGEQLINDDFSNRSQFTTVQSFYK